MAATIGSDHNQTLYFLDILQPSRVELDNPKWCDGGNQRQATPILSLTNATPLVSTLLKYQNQHNVGNGDAMFATQNSSPFSRHKV